MQGGIGKVREQKMQAIEKKAMLVESEYFSDVMYAIDREGKGMHIVYKNTIIPVACQ
jgi:hypothetical protein